MIIKKVNIESACISFSRLSEELLAELAEVKDSSQGEIMVALMLGEAIWTDDAVYTPLRRRNLEAEMGLVAACS